MQRVERNAPELQVWGGVECSHVLVGGTVRDQIAETGHRDRAGDLDLIASLGVSALRYPVLWASMSDGGEPDFTWHDARFARLRDLGLRPIAGFLHHGSGPGGLTPSDPGFVGAFGDFAEAVARRYPWITDFTPINEPVTTARFSCLYGLWHPHARDEGAFLRMVAASATATAEAMRRIRRVTPGARLIQTEDIGRIFSTPLLAYQADYENERRFLGFDLLCGHVRPGHAFWDRLLAAGVDRRDLDALADKPCPPDIVGVDQYLTSDRFLDDDMAAHPHAAPGGNGRHTYVDIAAAHVDEVECQTGILPRLLEAHDRYGLPLAVTENHNGCTREEQVRWLHEAWRAAHEARRRGADVRAVTSWSLFGAVDWNSLLTKMAGHYESGAFDARFDPPRPTAVATTVAALARDGVFRHAVLDAPGWWRSEGGHTAPPLLRVSGRPALVASVLDCCAVRRLRVSTGSEPALLGDLRVTEPAGPNTLLLEWHRRGRMLLAIEAACDDDPCPAINDALDLVIDDERGLFRSDARAAPNRRMTRAEPEEDALALAAFRFRR